MNPAARADQLRRRARHLRDLATAIENLPVMRLDRWSDDDTWRGPRPWLCRSTLQRNQHQLHVAADDIRWHAYHFELEAERLDAVARSPIGLAG